MVPIFYSHLLMNETTGAVTETIEDQTENVIEFVLGRQLTVNELTFLHHVVSLLLIIGMFIMSTYMVVK